MFVAEDESSRGCRAAAARARLFHRTCLIVRRTIEPYFRALEPSSRTPFRASRGVSTVVTTLLARASTMVVSREAEGHDRPEAELPIDIHYAKLVDWLVDRKKISADWRKKLAAVHAKMAELTRALPATLARAVGPGVPDPALLAADGEPPRWDYFRAVVVRDRILAGASAEPSEDPADGDDAGDGDGAKPAAAAPTRGLFGRLAGKAKAWDDVVRAYERDALHLPEAALTMTRGVDYDLPHHRAAVAKCAKQLQDLDRREGEYRRGATAARDAFVAACADLGVAPEARSRPGGFAAAVATLTDGLDDVFRDAAAAARAEPVGEAAAHYTEWIAWAHGRDATVEELLPSLARLLAFADDDPEPADDVQPGANEGGFSVGGDERPGANEGGFSVGGDATPAEIVAPPAGGIDWDLGDVTVEDESAPGTVEPPAGGIDWDLGDVTVEDESAPGTVEPPAGGIDWDLDVGEGDASGSGSGAPAEIDWNVEAEIVVEDAGGGVDSDSRANVDDDATAATVVGLDGIAASSSARPFSAVLARRAFRAGAVDDLLELRAFLRQRASDLRGKEATTLLSSAPASIRANVSPDAMSSLADACEAPVRVLRRDAARRALLVSTSARFRDRLAARLEAKGALEGKLLAALGDVDERRAETRLRRSQAAARAETTRRALRDVKSTVEAFVSKQYEGRATNVIGEINTALA